MKHGGVVVAVALAAGVMAFGPRLQSLQAAPAHVIQYQGRLTDLNGVPLEGQVHELRFKIYSSATPSVGAFVWGELHQNVPVNRGVFTVYLGSGAHAIDVNDNHAGPAQGFTGQFDGSSRFIQVTVLRTAGDTPEVLAPLNQVGSVPYAIQAGGSVPIGSIVDWYRPSPSTAVPPGWAICNGLAVNDPDSPLNGQPTPNLIGRFVRGLDPAAMTGTAYGANLPPGGTSLPDSANGQLNLSHAHSLPQHSHNMDHTHDAGTHTHSMSHQHRVAGRTGGADQTVPVSSAPYSGGPFGHSHTFEVTSDDANVSQTGPASGSTGSSSRGQTDPVSFASDPALGVVTVVPPAVGLLKIMRVR